MSEKELSQSFNIYKTLRLCNDYKISYIASELGVTPQHVRDIEKGVRNPSSKVKADFIKIIKIDEKTFNELEKLQKKYNDKESSVKLYQLFLLKALKILTKV